MSYEPTLAGSEQMLKKSVKAKVLFHFHRKRRTRLSVEKMFQTLSKVAYCSSENLKMSLCLFCRKKQRIF